jgi:hypothetical protein
MIVRARPRVVLTSKGYKAFILIWMAGAALPKSNPNSSPQQSATFSTVSKSTMRLTTVVSMMGSSFLSTLACAGATGLNTATCCVAAPSCSASFAISAKVAAMAERFRVMGTPARLPQWIFYRLH